MARKSTKQALPPPTLEVIFFVKYSTWQMQQEKVPRYVGKTGKYLRGQQSSSPGYWIDFYGNKYHPEDVEFWEE